MRTFFLLLVAACLLATSVSATPSFCYQRKKKTVFYSENGRCPRRTKAIPAASLPSGPQGAAGEAGPMGPSHLIGAVSADQGGDLKSHAKGAGLTSVATSRLAAGNYLVVFTGTFEGLTDAVKDRERIISFCTAYNSGSKGVCTTRINQTSETEIEAQVWTWNSTTGVLTDNQFNLSAFLGEN